MVASVPVDSRASEAAFLSEASKSLAASLDYDATLLRVAQVAVPALADWCAVDILESDGSLRRAAVTHADPDKEILAKERAHLYSADATSADGVPGVLRTGRSQLLSELPRAARVNGDGQSGADAWSACELGLGCGMIVPLVARERTLGALSLARRGGGQPYGEADLRLAEDLAERCALAIDNARLYRIACQATEVRDTFLATVSHDLRNPLATISGQAQLLRRLAARQPTPLPRQVTDGLARIDSTVLRMTRMIDDLLDVTQLELGRPLDLDRQRVDLVDLSRRIVAEHQHRTDKHLIRVAGEPELVGDWDRPRLERVLDNLLSNAVKYSPDGGVITVVVAHEEDETGSWAILSVRDQGVGIPAADLPRIFERYHRAQNVGRTGGRGIGLAVIREIVERHAGSISVESYEGQGSTFTIRLPLCTP